MQNIWLSTNKRVVDYLKRTLIEASYQPMYQEFPIKKFQYIMNGFESELTRLENENDALKNKIRELERVMKDTDNPKPEPDSDPNEDSTIQPV
jgi:hypothetical protein